MAAYFEAVDSSDIGSTLPDEVFVEARQSLAGFMKPDQPDWPRAVALLRPLAKHKDLRDLVLTTGVVDGFLQLLDHIIVVQGEHFAHVMDALSSLVEFHPRYLTAVLRVVNILAERDPLRCYNAEPRLHELARAQKGPVSLLAVQALVELLGAKLLQEPVQYLHAGTANNTPAREWMRIGDSLLYKLFSARTLGNNRREFIQKLLDAAGGRHTRARTAATFTLLKLCNFDIHLQSYVLEQGVLDILVKQLQYKDTALLAAYALTRCLSHEIFSKPIYQNPVLAGYIVNMIRLDYFDEAVGVTEGFAILEDLLRCDKLKRQILEYDIAALLERKLGAGQPAEMRTSLNYLNIFRIYGEDSLTQNLVERGMSHLRTNQWRSQKAGVAYSVLPGSNTYVQLLPFRTPKPFDLCAGFGVEALKQVIAEVVDTILPTHDSNTQQAINTPYIIQSKPPSSLLGPAFVIRVLANNEEIRQTAGYKRLKHLFLFGDLLGAKETPIWQVNAPTRNDVLNVINQMIKSVDSVEGSTKGFILPDIRHWDRIFRLLRDGVVWAIIIPSVVASVAVLVAVGAVAVAPVVLSRKIAEWVGRPWYLRQQDEIIRSLRLPDTESPRESLASSVPLNPGPSGHGVLLFDG
ncbi:hypothetical protein JVT61DRAFT_8031 [Boletus reticuloceps]|uniref:Uncharacterized protein n=1 Tax=Boletus reticuloceps TaxID=495285 RepID=A0A8I3A6I9_9AGAM|nr:hypothetical protein JVT61DRAFT_8031 [Boletus reticuloceps]